MKLASGTAADFLALLAVPSGCQLRVCVAHLPAPWSLYGLVQLNLQQHMQLHQQVAAVCDDQQ